MNLLLRFITWLLGGLRTYLALIFGMFLGLIVLPFVIVAQLLTWPFTPARAKRTAGDYQRMIARAKELFAQIARRHGLRLEWDNKSPVEAAATLPEQPGLDFRLWLNLQNVDEIGIQTELFTASWFPFDDPKRETEFLTAVDGLISGEVRMLCFYGPIFAKPYKVILQRRIEDRWEMLCSYGILGLCLLGWPAKTEIIVNGGSSDNMRRE